MFASSLCVLLTVAAPPVSDTHARMIEDARTYFEAEKTGTATFMFVGASSLLAGAMLGFSNDDTAHGAAVPVSILGLAQLVVGGLVFFRTDAQLAALEAQIRSDPDGYVNEEMPRIRAVNDRFALFQIVEVALVVVGGVVAAYGSIEDEPWIEGLGYGVAIQAAIVFVGDTLAEARAERYEHAIEDFSVTIGQTRDVAGQRIETVGLALGF